MWKSLKNNDFLKNVVTLLSGTVIAQSIMLAFTPIITRLFTPDDFGIFSLYLAIVTVISTIGCLKYDLAIVLPKNKRDGYALLNLSITIAVTVMLGLFLLVVIFKPMIVNHIDKQIAIFIWIIPLGVLVSSIFQAFTSFNTRQKAFKSSAMGKVGEAVSMASLKSLFGVQGLGSYGLIWGHFGGKLIGIIVVISTRFKELYVALSEFSVRRIFYNAKKYSDFPKYQSGATFLNALSQNIPIILLTFLYSTEIAGYFALAYRVLMAPVMLIGQSTREVYYQKASELFSKGEDINKLLIKTTLFLVAIGIIPFLLLGFFAPQLFHFVFGDEWYVAGKYAQICVAWIFLAFINPPSVMTLQILGLQRFFLKYEVFLLLFRTLSIWATFYVTQNHYLSIIMYVLIGVGFNIFLIAFNYLRYKKYSRAI